MNKSLITGLIVGGVAVTAAGAFAGYQAMDNRHSAEVLNVEQLTRTVRTPRLGNQIGGGPGPTVATVAGAAAGGYAGSKVQENMQDGKTTQTVEQRCRTVYDSVEKPDGYQVRYRMGDRDGTVRMDHDPGRSIPVENGELVLTSLNNRQ